jgi:hypothetical protein
MHPCKRCRLCGIFWDETLFVSIIWTSLRYKFIWGMYIYKNIYLIGVIIYQGAGISTERTTEKSELNFQHGQEIVSFPQRLWVHPVDPVSYRNCTEGSFRGEKWSGSEADSRFHLVMRLMHTAILLLVQNGYGAHSPSYPICTESSFLCSKTAGPWS